MDDPWDVKSVRQAGQYTSCMKLNGAPLLPPVLSKECRKEMQYYKLLAKEVEKRISILQPYVEGSDTESIEDKTDAPETPESEKNYELARENVEAAFDLSINNITDLAKQKNLDTELPTSDVFNLSAPNIVTATDTAPSKFVIDFSLSINQQTGKNVLETIKSKPQGPSPAIEIPERDYNCVKTRELLLDVESNSNQRELKKDKVIYNLKSSFNGTKDQITDPFLDFMSIQEGPPSISSKNFTGSLNDLHSECEKTTPIPTRLVRQSSYTLLNPSPQLLAHLEVQSLNTGIEMNCISMSESLSNLSIPNKKRRSWDLESAKVKWSSMALELKTKQLPNSTPAANKNAIKLAAKNTTQAIYSPPRAKSVVSEKIRRNTPKSTPKSDSFNKRRPSPVRNIPSNVTIVKGPASPKQTTPKKDPVPLKPATPKPVVSESEDPATKVRELYDKIQKQQLIQMASLVEKQKREQMLLQQVFEEQNTLLFKQLKTIVPKSPVEMKEAWGEKSMEADRGPVSLSQLINHKSPEQSHSPIFSTLTDTNKYIDKCDNILKKSRDLSGSIKKPKCSSQNGAKVQSTKIPEGSRTRTHSPVRNTSVSSPVSRNTSRKLNYDTASSYDPILTDRTNDTMADLNVTFPTDNSDECDPCSHNNHPCRKDASIVHENLSPTSTTMSTDSAINCMERTIQNSINSSCLRRPKSNTYQQPTAREVAAAAKLVAYAKGHLVRRLMRTERVMATVQTIRDALLCALQLHQDRQGIRGADVDLHRRLIQQITAACYSLHDTFISSSAAQRCALLAADRARRRTRPARPSSNTSRHEAL